MVEFNTNQDTLQNPNLLPVGDMDTTKESIELTKNTKGYGWKVKVKDEQLSEATLSRLKVIINKLEVEYGN